MKTCVVVQTSDKHVLKYLVDKIPGAKLETLLADQPQFTLYEYGVGDAVRLDRAAHLELPPDKAP